MKPNLASEQSTYIFMLSISPTFYEQLFGTKVFCAAVLTFCVCKFWQKKIGMKAAHKI